MMRFPEALRIPRPRKDGLYSSNPGDRHGCFKLTIGQRVLWILAADASIPAAQGWEHVSVSVLERGSALRSALPTWEEMAMIAEKFWEPEDCVVQFRPPKALYVDQHPALHWWRQAEGGFPMPPVELV